MMNTEDTLRTATPEPGLAAVEPAEFIQTVKATIDAIGITPP